MHEIKLDENKNRLFPHPKVLEAYADEERGNNFARNTQTPDEDRYNHFYNSCKKKPFNLQAIRVIRTRTIVAGKLTEVIYFYGHVIGTNQSGGEELWEGWFGLYDEPFFTRHLDKETDQFVVDGIRTHIRRYEWEVTPENIEHVFQYVDDGTTLLVKESPETNTADIIIDREGFQKANFLQLLEMGKRKRTLAEIIQLASNTLAVGQDKAKEEEKPTLVETEIVEEGSKKKKGTNK